MSPKTKFLHIPLAVTLAGIIGIGLGTLPLFHALLDLGYKYALVAIPVSLVLMGVWAMGGLAVIFSLGRRIDW